MLFKVALCNFIYKEDFVTIWQQNRLCMKDKFIFLTREFFGKENNNNFKSIDLR